MLDCHRLSVKSGWFDENGEVYVYFKREEMQTQLGLSERTIVKVMQELKNFTLVEEKQQGLSKPNKIYVLSPVIYDEDPSAYLDPDIDYNPDKDHKENYDGLDEQRTGYGITPSPVSEELRFQTLKNYDSISDKIAVSGSVNFVSADPQNLRPINNKLINNKKNNNYLTLPTAKAGGFLGVYDRYQKTIPTPFLVGLNPKLRAVSSARPKPVHIAV